MKISFDLDGVIADTDKWIYSMLDHLGLMNGSSMESSYYATRQVKYDPYMFLSENDEGFILTARRSASIPVTIQWMLSRGIDLPIIWVDQSDTIDWHDYKAGSKESARRKAFEINRLSIDTHFDNNPYIVKELRLLLPGYRKIVQIGGEPCLYST